MNIEYTIETKMSLASSWLTDRLISSQCCSDVAANVKSLTIEICQPY